MRRSQSPVDTARLGGIFNNHALHQAGETVTITQSNAMDLSGFPDCAYDITLLLGPMYHLYTDEDKHMAMSEALRVTKQGGIVLAAYAM